MIILDTNVISELMKQLPDTIVIDWINQQETSELFITAITIAEISYGLYTLPEGKRRRVLKQAFMRVVNEVFKHRILEFSESAAYHYGKLMAHRKSIGRPLDVCDGQIAAIALLHGHAIATRNINDFLNCTLELINPFKGEIVFPD